VLEELDDQKTMASKPSERFYPGAAVAAAVSRAPQPDRPGEEPRPAGTTSPTRRYLVVSTAVLLATVVWAFWPDLGDCALKWQTDPQYSHGYLVPAFAAFILWQRRARLKGAAFAPSWWGVPVLLAGGALHLLGAWFFLAWPEQVSLLPVLAGITLALGGRPAWRWAWPAIAFLFFMVPLPGGAFEILSMPLQRVGTVASTYVLQTLGLPALAEGNIIVLSENVLEVAQACNGLHMMVVFVALSTGVAMLIRRTMVERILIVVSAFPIAVIANIARITITGVLYEMVNNERAKHLFHDYVGWLMMVIGLILLWVELFVLSRLIQVADSSD
jgi:exosortase